ncbi:MAG: DUF1934 family protein [Solobacterium sp.]|nr:DUF1934 family protein [Solobacterium sp.]
MIVSVRAWRTDHLEGTSDLFLDGRAIFDGVQLKAEHVADGEKSKEYCTFHTDHVILVHQGATQSRIRLYEGRNGSAEVISPFGTMVFSAVLNRYEKREEDIILRYWLFQGNQLVADNELRFEIGSKKAIPEGHA